MGPFVPDEVVLVDRIQSRVHGNVAALGWVPRSRLGKRRPAKDNAVEVNVILVCLPVVAHPVWVYRVYQQDLVHIPRRWTQ